MQEEGLLLVLADRGRALIVRISTIFDECIPRFLINDFAKGLSTPVFSQICASYLDTRL
jgi:hypothetical protein